MDDEFQIEPNRLAYILMEIGETSLANYLEIHKSSKKYLSLKLIKKLMTVLIKGFAFLQDQNIAHQDIKPENILIMKV